MIADTAARPPPAAAPAPLAPLPGTAALLAAFGRAYVARYLPVYAVGLAFLFATNWLTVTIPSLVKDIFDALQAGARDRIDRLSLAIAACAAAVIVVRTLSRVLFFNPGRTIEFRLRNDMLARLLAMGGGWYRRVAHGDLVSRATNDASFVRALVGFALLQLLNLAFASALALWRMFHTDVVLTLLCLLPMLASVWVLRRGTGRLYGAMRDGQAELGALSDHILETYKGIAAIALAHAEPAFLRRFDHHNQRYTAIHEAVTALRCFVLPLATQAGGVAVFVLLFYGGARVIDGALTVGDLAAYGAYISVLVGAMVMAGWLIGSIQRGVVALERVWEVAALPAERLQRGEALPPAAAPGLRVRARGLGHRYADAAPGAPPALEAVDLEIEPGTILGIYGGVGAGKSTLLALLAGDLTPAPGTLFFDGVDAAALDPGARAAAVAVVPQIAFLFSRPLRENIGFVDPPQAIDDAAVARALAAAQLDAEAARLPQGLATVVGERGQMLSGGQRQRAQLARALYRPARLLLLDDVLSAVDHDTEQRMIDALDAVHAQARPTVVLVSSRLSALQRADAIVVLDGGRVVERGSHAALLAAGGRYAAAHAAADAATTTATTSAAGSGGVVDARV